MTAGAGGDRDQAIRALFDRLACETVIDDVVQRDATPAMHRGIEILTRAERGDNDRDLPFGARREIGFEPFIGAMDDLIDRIGCGRAIGIVAIPRREFFGDAVEPFVELCLRPGIECREGADDSCLALGDDQVRTGDDEQRRTDDGQAQALQDGGQAHKPVS